jgi:GNAT superfamily N-acetyltransferase
MSHTEIRGAGPDDLAVLQRIYRRASLSNPGDREVLLAHPDALVWSGDGLSEGRTVLAVTADGEVVGFATIAPAGDAAELADLFVDPDHRRRGAASQLTRAVAALARRGGARWLDVIANPHAAAFYTAVGFVPAGTEETRFGRAARLRLRVAETRSGIDDDVPLPAGNLFTPAPPGGHQPVSEPIEPADDRRH